MNRRSTYQAHRRMPSVNLRYAAYLVLASSIAASVYALTMLASRGHEIAGERCGMVCVTQDSRGVTTAGAPNRAGIV